MNIKRPQKIHFFTILRWVIAPIAILVICYQLRNNLTGISFSLFREVLTYKAISLILVLLLMALLNWSIEALKWMVLVRTIEKISFNKAIKAVFNGLSLGFITPNRIGDALGRVLHLNSERRFEAIGGIFISRMSQLLTTLIFGVLGLVFIIYRINFISIDKNTALSLSVVVVLILLLLYFNIKRLVKFLNTKKWLSKLMIYVGVIEDYNFSLLFSTLLLSILRYTVFFFQFYIVLYIFKIDISFIDTFACIAVTFLAKSIVPFFNVFGEVGIREISAIYLFSIFAQPEINVLASSLTLWLINIVLPALVGLFFTSKMSVNAV